MNREYLSNKLKDKVRELAVNDDILYIVPLGGLRDSAAHISYFWNDIQIENLTIETGRTLEELLLSEETDQIVFFDDGSFSGTQVTSIMQEYMGINERKTNEKHVQELSPECKQALQEKKIRFFFIAFNKSKEASIIKELAKIGLKNISFNYIEDMNAQWLEQNQNTIFESEEQRLLVKETLQDVGLAVMKSLKMSNGECKQGWSLQRIEDAALGYNNAQQMVFLKSSVPTYTITAFWAEGSYKGFEWKPLFRRTNK